MLILVWKVFRRWVEGARDREFTLPGAGEDSARIAFRVSAVLADDRHGGVARRNRDHRRAHFGQTQFWEWAGIGIASGLFEETLFRGVLLRHLEQLFGT